MAGAGCYVTGVSGVRLARVPLKVEETLRPAADALAMKAEGLSPSGHPDLRATTPSRPFGLRVTSPGPGGIVAETAGF